jgi:hypothetical protein
MDAVQFEIAPIPEVGYDVPEALFVAEHTGRDVNNIIAPTMAEYQARNRVVLDVLKLLRSTSDVEVIDVAMRMCDLQRCTVADSGGFGTWMTNTCRPTALNTCRPSVKASSQMFGRMDHCRPDRPTPQRSLSRCWQ